MRRPWQFPALARLAIVALVAVACGCGGGEGNHGEPPPTPKFLTYAGLDLDIVPGQYVVVFDDARVAPGQVRTLARKLAGAKRRIRYVFTTVLRGFVARNKNDAWARGVSARDDVVVVRKDFRIQGSELRGGVFGPVPWNLDRVDQRAPFALDRDFRLKTGPTANGAPVPVYVLDNGIYRDHNEFMTAGGSRIGDVADLTGHQFARCAAPDGNHGTRLASIAAGRTLGITPTLVKNVKVLDRGLLGDCISGSPATVVMGIDRVAQDMQAHQITRAVVNLSLGWPSAPGVPDVDAAVQRLQARGALVVAAAGNEGVDAAGVTPAHLPGVVAVGATNERDERGIFTPTKSSNFGATVTLWAPGVTIKGADWPASPDPAATSFGSGTSEAAPHVAGAAALLWQQNPTLSANEVAGALRDRATRNMLLDLRPGSTNALLYVGEGRPAPGTMSLSPLSLGDGALNAVRVAYGGTRVYVVGGDPSGGTPAHEPFAYAAFDPAHLDGGPVREIEAATHAASPDCLDLQASTTISGGGGSGEAVYIGCVGTRAGAREGLVIATEQDINVSLWGQPTWLGPRTEVDGIADNSSILSHRVFVIGTRRAAPPSGNTEVFVTSINADDGSVIGTQNLTAAGFSEAFHRGVDLVLVDVPLDSVGNTTRTELVAATYSDPPGPDKTFLWRLNPDTLAIEDWREVPVPQLATNGMVATALAVQDLETNLNGLLIPAEVFLATSAIVVDGPVTGPWAYIFRLKPDRVTVQGGPIDVVKDALVTSLWSADNDLYLAGSTTRTFSGESLTGTRKPGASPDFDAFVGKSEGIVGRRRWMTGFEPAAGQNDIGHGGFGNGRAYIVGSNSDDLYVAEFPVY